MEIKKCPLCMEKLVRGECLSCGYRVPNEEDLSSVYSCDPSEYPQEEPAVREIYPEVQAEEIYPNRDERPELKFKVHDDNGNTVGKEIYPISLDKGEKNHYTDNNSPYANNGNIDANNGNPFVDNGSANGEFSAFLQEYWWLLLLSFFIPIIGLFIYLSDKKNLRQSKYKWLVIAAMIVGLIVPF